MRSFIARQIVPGIVLITGGSRGIGAATAYLAARRGYTTCIAYRQNEKAATNVVETITAAGGRGHAFAADVSVERDVRQLFSRITSELGPISALVNNAGVLEQQMPFEEMELARWQRTFATNVMGAFLCAREAVKQMSTTNGGAGGTIVNVSSVAARLGAPNEYVDYAASKAAIDTFTIGLAKEVAPQGIRVNAVRPGAIATEIHASGGEPNRVERVRKAVPMQRGGEVEEVAQAILWLLSDEASYITGACLEITGGL